MAGLACLALGHTNDLHALNTQGAEHIERLAHLAQTAVDEENIRQHAFAGLNALVATLQRLMHGRVIVAAGDTTDIEAPVL